MSDWPKYVASLSFCICLHQTDWNIDRNGLEYILISSASDIKWKNKTKHRIGGWLVSSVPNKLLCLRQLGRRLHSRCLPEGVRERKALGPSRHRRGDVQQGRGALPAEGDVRATHPYAGGAGRRPGHPGVKGRHTNNCFFTYHRGVRDWAGL